jgi:RND family efflux transporter MFP subunit
MTELDLEKLRIDKDGLRPKSRRRRAWLWGLALLAAVAAAALLYRQGLLTPAIEIQTALVQNVYTSQSLTLLNASGYVVADRKSAVASKLTGRLVYLGVEEGSPVQEGQVIARLENKDALAARDRAAANVSVARHNLAQAKAERDNAALDFERKQNLAAKGTIARALFDAAEARHLTAEAAVRAQESALRAAEAARTEAEVLLDYTNIRAPFDAVVLTKNADIGDIVTPLAATADAKAAVVTIADMSSLVVEVDVSEADIAKVRVGQPCEIRLDAFAERRFPGAVHMVLPTADRSKASVTVKIAFRERDPRILPEMSAKAAFLSRAVGPGEEAPVRAVPGAAIVPADGGAFVFQVDGERVRAVPAAPGRRLGEMRELLEGPPVGTRVATAPLERLKDGARVAIPKP